MFARFIYILLLSSVFAQEISSQTQSENYILTRTMLDADGASYMESVQYYDGYGRPTIYVTTAGTNGESTYSLTTYDALDRKENTYLPVVSGTSMEYKMPQSIKQQSSPFYTDSYPFYHNNYDALDRIVSTDMPGIQWRIADRKRKNEYSCNVETDSVKHYEAPIGSTSLVKPENATFAYYPAGALKKTTTYDEDDKYTEKFFDLFDNLILERSADVATYYVYNDYGQLRFVLTPGYEKHAIKDKYAYEYRYDARGRIEKKILPGCEYIRYWYDKYNNLAYVQDARLREEGKYRFMLYDNLGRLAIQGLCTNCQRGENISAVVSYKPEINGILNSGYQFNDSVSNQLTNASVEIVNFYDTYNFVEGNKLGAFTGWEFSSTVNQIGNLTGSVLSATTGGFLARVMSYDLRGNLIESLNKDLDGKMHHQYISYTNTGYVLKDSIIVSAGNVLPLTIVRENTYSPVNDKLMSSSIALCQAGRAKSIPLEYSYDALGRLATITRGQTNGQASTVSYEYDMHGWVTHHTAGRYSETLYYAVTPGIPCYNGNISCKQWQLQRDYNPRFYRYTYDAHNRLTNALYSERDMSHNQDRFNENMSYDECGNIKRLKRYGLKMDGKYGKTDNLHLAYTGMQLTSVTEDAEPVNYNGALGFNGTPYNTYSLTYNSCGALTSDEGRGITHIDYDERNNPIRIQFANGNVTSYVYSADGQKLRVLHETAVPNLNVALGCTHELSVAELLCADSIDYMLDGALVLENGNFDKYIFDEGYIQFVEIADITNAEPFALYYYNKDYQGNVREVVDENGTVKQSLNYYPLGLTFYEGYTPRYSFQPYKYTGKELDLMHGLNTYDHGARQYNPVTGLWDRMDPFCEKYYHLGPYAYCGGNPVNVIDPTGCDTLNIAFNQGKWIFSDPIIAKGDDVFNVTIDGVTNAYTFSEGEYGDRVDALNLESNEDYTLGVYHISGVSSQGTGYYVTPGGAPSTKNGSKARIPEGIYPIIDGRGMKWKKAGVGGSVEGRGIRFHYEVSRDHNPRWSTDGCFVLSYDYTTHKNGSIIYNRNESISASRNFDILVGGAYPYINKNNGREATKFLNPITAILSLKSRTK